MRPLPQFHGPACDVYNDVKGKRLQSPADSSSVYAFTRPVCSCQLVLCYSFRRLLRHDEPLDKVKTNSAKKIQLGVKVRGVLLTMLAVSIHREALAITTVCFEPCDQESPTPGHA